MKHQKELEAAIRQNQLYSVGRNIVWSYSSFPVTTVTVGHKSNFAWVITSFE